jgi:CBS domain containing-hemolysin-like protein
MKKGAECFSRLMFWMENSIYIFYFILSEVILFPLIYFKVMITVGYLADWKRLIPLIVFWVVFGPFVCVFNLAKDLFFYLKILCDYQDEEEHFKEKEEEDFK